MNSILPCAKSEDQENEQSHSDITANCTAISNAEKCSTPVAAGEKEGLVQSSNRNAVAEDGAIADHANINRPENIDAMLTFETENTAAVASVTANLQNSADSFKLNKVECNTCDSTEHNLKSVSDQTSKSEVTTPTGLAVESQINTTAAIVESSDAAFKPSGREKEENDLKNKRVEGTDEDREKENSYSEGDYQIKEEFTSLDEKEASSDEADHFVDAKSSTQISGASGDDAAEIGEEIKEQIEEIQDEEGYEYDEEEQEAEPDDDEVESNPAFIPKSGRYYMHDSRNTDEERTPEPSSHSRADGKWKHDRFDERSQRPKTKRELMNRYGYDIRNEGKNTDGGGVNPSTPHSNQTRGTSRGGSSGGNIYGNRGRNSTRAPSHHPQHQPDRRDHRRPIQNSGAGRPANRGGRKSDHRLSMNHQKDHGTRVFKNSPINAQKGNI
uniref:Protein CASC3 n=1 Tax=Elaeophora elaphi TaxID=1147741 RepID=A0A0R3RZV5_9BILA